MATLLPLMVVLSLLAIGVNSQPQRSNFRRPEYNRIRQSSFEGPPPYQPGYQPEKAPEVPIPVGVRSECKLHDRSSYYTFFCKRCQIWSKT